MRLTIKEVDKILKNYNLGKVIKIQRLTKGYANINYKLNTTKGTFFLRICKYHSLEEIQYEMKVMNELKKTKFPTAFPIKRIDGKYINNVEFGEVVIYEYVIGKEPEANSETVREIAKAVAKLNSIKSWKKLKKGNTKNLKWCKSTIKRFGKAKNKYLKIFEYFKEETKFISKPLREKLPKGLVHGDIFTDNTKFKDNKLVAILDFENVCTDNLLFDVGMTINGFCFKNNKLDLKLLHIFLKEYDKTRKLSLKEKRLLPYYIQWGAHAMICFHLSHIINKKEIKKLKRANYLMDRVKRLRKAQYSKFYSFLGLIPRSSAPVVF